LPSMTFPWPKGTWGTSGSWNWEELPAPISVCDRLNPPLLLEANALQHQIVVKHALRTCLRKQVTVQQSNAGSIFPTTRSQTPGEAQITHPWQKRITKTRFTKQRNQLYYCARRNNKSTPSTREPWTVNNPVGSEHDNKYHPIWSWSSLKHTHWKTLQATKGETRQTEQCCN
jgi:hypothetical protein